MPDPFNRRNRDLIIALAARYGVPAIFYDRALAVSGGLIDHGQAEECQTSPKSAKIEPIGSEFPKTVSLALVPLHPRGTRCHGVVVPL
jgi:hypothetical protein